MTIYKSYYDIDEIIFIVIITVDVITGECIYISKLFIANVVIKNK